MIDVIMCVRVYIRLRCRLMGGLLQRPAARVQCPRLLLLGHRLHWCVLRLIVLRHIVSRHIVYHVVSYRVPSRHVGAVPAAAAPAAAAAAAAGGWRQRRSASSACSFLLICQDRLRTNISFSVLNHTLVASMLQVVAVASNSSSSSRSSSMSSSRSSSRSRRRPEQVRGFSPFLSFHLFLLL